MLGAMARIEEIVEIANAHKIPVLEDTAQAAGGRINGRHLGTFGQCGTFSFDSVKTMTTGEGGMVITSDEEMWRTMSEYHDHGHDHAVNPGGRGGEGRSFIGFNYRMMELQGAMGIAQLAKLDGMISAQRRHKARLRDAASAIPGVKFRKLVDEAGDTATFFAFILESRDQCQKVSTILADEGVPAINFSENTWHFYPSWEHLHKGAAVAASGYPFNDAGGKRRIVYDPDVLPKSADLMARTLIYPIAIKMDETQLAKICNALEKAAAA